MLFEAKPESSGPSGCCIRGGCFFRFRRTAAMSLGVQRFSPALSFKSFCFRDQREDRKMHEPDANLLPGTSVAQRRPLMVAIDDVPVQRDDERLNAGGVQCQRSGFGLDLRRFELLLHGIEALHRNPPCFNGDPQAAKLVHEAIDVDGAKLREAAPFQPNGRGGRRWCNLSRCGHMRCCRSIPSFSCYSRQAF